MIFIVFEAAAMAALTWLVGWWGVLVVALIAGVVFRREGGGGWRIAVAGALAWGALLVVDALSGPLDTLMHRLAPILHVPPLGLVVATLLYPTLLAWSAATASAAIARGVVRQRRKRS
jgi:hypothetical protein